MGRTGPGKYDGILWEVSVVLGTHHIICDRGIHWKQLKFSFEIT